jgi:hypothetical protein
MCRVLLLSVRVKKARDHQYSDIRALSWIASSDTKIVDWGSGKLS